MCIIESSERWDVSILVRNPCCDSYKKLFEEFFFSNGICVKHFKDFTESEPKE